MIFEYVRIENIDQTMLRL